MAILVAAPTILAIFLRGRVGPCWIVTLLLGTFSVVSPVQAQQTPSLPETSEHFHGAHLPTDRSAWRSFEAARELIDQGRFADGLPLVQRVLEAENDSFTPQGEGLKQRALQLLKRLSGDGRDGLETYRLLFEHQLQSQTEAAIQRRSTDALARIAATAPYDPSGATAWRAWAALEEDHGHYELAAALYDRMLVDASDNNTEHVASRQALQLFRTGHHVEAVESLQDLTLGPGTRDRLEQHSTAALRRWEVNRPPYAWCGVGGDPRRAAAAGPTLSAGWPEWNLHHLPHGRGASHASAAANNRVNASRLAPPNAVCLDDTAVVSVDSLLLGIDAVTGKRVWSVDLQDSRESGPMLNAGTLAEELGITGLFGRDRPTLLACDTQRVYAVTESPGREFSGQQSRGLGATWSEQGPANTLHAFSVAEQGKRVWSIDGGAPNHDLTGAYFLGPPTPYEGRLGCLVVVDETIECVWLDAPTGDLLWRQPLVNLERGVESRPSLDLAGVGVGVHGGLAVCPTGAGAVVAIDVPTRSLAWAQWLPHGDAEAPDRQADLFEGMEGRAEQWLAGVGWRWPRALIDSERVVVASPESPGLHAFDRESGELLWRRHIEHGLLLSSLAAGASPVVIVVESEALSAWRADSGEPAWRVELPAGVAPSGEGLLVGEEYWLPLDSGELFCVRVVDGLSDEDRASTVNLSPGLFENDSSLGTLVCSGGKLMATSEGGVSVFARIEEDRSIKALRAGDPLRALELLSDSNHDTDKTAAGIALLATELHEAPQDQVRRLTTLVAGPSQRLDAALLVLHASTEWDRAFLDALDALIAGPSARYVEPEPGRAVVAENWISASLSRWLAEAPHTEAAELDAEVAARIGRAMLTADTHALSVYAKACEHLPASSQARRGLSRLSNQELHWSQVLTTENPHETGSTSTETQPWANTQVLASVDISENTSRRSQRSRRFGRRTMPRNPRLETRVVWKTRDTPVRWRIESGASEALMLVGEDAQGEVAVTLDMPDFTPSRGTPASQPQGVQWGRRLCVSSGSGLSMHDCRRGIEPLDRLLWREAIGSAEARAPLRLYTPASTRDTTTTSSGDASDRTAAILDISFRGVVLQEDAGLVCRDIIDGTRVWRRSDLDWARRFVSVGEVGYAVDDRTRRGVVVSLVDGSTLREWSPPSGLWVAQYDAQALAQHRVSQATVVERFDLEVSEEEPVWSQLIERDTLTRSYSDTGFAMCDTEGNLAWTDLELDEHVIQADTTIASAATPEGFLKLSGDSNDRWRGMYATRVGERMIVMFNREEANALRQRRLRPMPSTRVFSGLVYCFDWRTGAMMWPAPAEVDGLSLIDTGLADSPWALFAVRVLPDQQDDLMRMRLCALDLDTGRLVFERDDLPAPTTNGSQRLSFYFEQTPAPRLVADIGQVKLRLTATDRAAPPAPPLVDRVESADPHGDTNELLYEGIEQLFRSIGEAAAEE